MRLALLFMVMLIGSIGFSACSDDADEPTPSASPTADEPTATATSTLADGDSPLEAEAAALCPPDFVSQCTEAYITIATGSLPAALCVSEAAGTWFMETPGDGVEVGDTCANNAAYTVVSLLNY